MILRILSVCWILSSQSISPLSLCFAEASPPVLPSRGICAHRGASATHPENTIAALREAVRLGAHMVEFDLALTKDLQIVLMHDPTVNRTTNGHGEVADLTLSELRTLDAGTWKSPHFQHERIPTFKEALDVLPVNIWINVHLKGDAELASKAAREIVEASRLHQAVLACGAEGAASAREIDPNILICNMDRQLTNKQYVRATIDQNAAFIQLLAIRPTEAGTIEQLKQHNIRINYCCTDDAKTLRKLFAEGLDFVLVDQLDAMLQEVEALGIERQEPIYSGE
ncbi:glycerophosphodiester phosphodiesterase [Bythopirellula polymerisocia]|uniref:Glycerophosphoryl diester phosphodiesterase n=1 Tax=Bythopirellula polymerisocia TaxID=2528003 RepID=A0A5C6CSY6_9BACT|nr:glycerophosphodiester phosphodiesterase family protein [Bythopirellula polymerisocia]TWU27508.1 Glycerophosphoryl diester phosphodiesterase [Bythopirellula polymerisocia]